MATQLFLQDPTFGEEVALSTDTDLFLYTTRRAGVGSRSGSTVTGPTSGIQIGTVLISYWYQVNAVTISGAITKNLWMSESNMSANVGAQTIIDRCDSSGTFISTVENSEKGTELPVTTATAQNWSTGTVTSTTFADGDYIRLRVYGNDVGTMATGFSFALGAGAASAGVDGDSYVTFTETITAFVAAAPRVPRFTPMPQLLAH